MKPVPVLWLLLVASSLALAAGDSLTTAGCMRKLSGAYTVARNVARSNKYVAWASFNDSLPVVGWGQLHVHAEHTSDTTTDEDVMYCAGLVEGVLTHTRISQHYKIYKAGILGDMNATDWPASLVSYITANIKYTQTTMEQKLNTDSWWRQVFYVVRHTDGILDGYNMYKTDEEESISPVDFWIYQAAGDMDDIDLFVDENNWHTDSAGLRKLHGRRDDNWYDTHQHCSGMVSLPNTFEDIYFSQDTWSAYNTMNRILKEYDFSINDTDTTTTKYTFSSHPGLGFSMDDFWQLDTKMLVLETTLHNWNNELYEKYCVPETVLCWIRVQVANRMSADGKSWCNNFIRENSGTYNNQYFVVDLKKFTPGTRPKSDLLWAIEQLPGNYKAGDRTAELVANGYVPSFNTPFFDSVGTTTSLRAKPPPADLRARRLPGEGGADAEHILDVLEQQSHADHRA
eukprot:TRINITY_DN616_c0_g1_i2.p1 TRINITY_DN616_c0_g1~~TRINITY_DN616_c0_g1_i2.p1  ORF type:complete len:456 (-),score=100.24 TRINITY_DN616_c0_g1_i2:1694-3061(-)